MNLNDIVALSKKTWHIVPNKRYDLLDVEIIYTTLALGGEVGELENKVKKFFRNKYYTEGHKEEDVVKKIGEELADILYYVGRLSEALKIDLDKEFAGKMEENQRRYGTV